MSSFLLHALAQTSWYLFSVFYFRYSSLLQDYWISEGVLSLSPLSYFLYFSRIPISHLGCSFFQLLFLFFQCYLHFIPPSPLNGAHCWRDHIHCKRRRSVCSGMPEDSEEAGTIRSQVTGSNHSIRAVSSGTPCCVVSFVRVVLHSHGATTLL